MKRSLGTVCGLALLMVVLTGCGGGASRTAAPSAGLALPAAPLALAALPAGVATAPGATAACLKSQAPGLGLAGLLLAQAPEAMPRRSFFDGWYVGVRPGIFISADTPYDQEADFGFSLFLGMDPLGARAPIDFVLQLDWIDTSAPLPNSIMVLSLVAELEHYFGGLPKYDKTRIYACLGGGWLFPVEDIADTGGHKGPGTGTLIGGVGLAWPLPGPAHWRFQVDARVYWMPDWDATANIIGLTAGVYYVF